MDMSFPFQINILEFIFKGILIGILTSAPMGPVGILCINRTLKTSRWFGFVTKFYLQIFGGVLILLFGIYSYRSNPMQNAHPSNGNGRGTLWHNALTAFAVTFSNLLIVPYFMMLFALFAFVIPDHKIEMCIGYASVLFGALLWWYGLTWLVDKIRTKFDDNGIVIINKVIGSVVIIFSLIALIGTIFNLYHLPELASLR